MAGAHVLTDIADPRLADYRDLMDRQLAALRDGTPACNGLFMAEGELVIRQLALSGLAIKSVLMSRARLETMADLVQSLPPTVPVYLLDQNLMNQVVGFNIHRGVLAAGFRPAPRPYRDLIATRSTLIILEDTANHDNMGGIFRIAAALGGLDRTAVLLSPRCCDPLYRKAIRVSMGTALRIPFATIDDWPTSLATLKDAGFLLVALTGAGDTAIRDLPRADRIALLLGAEGPGLGPDALAAADVRARIPMWPGVDSLNLVVAAGIALDHLAGPR